MNDTQFDVETNPAREETGLGQGYKTVLYAPTKATWAFPVNTADQDIADFFARQESKTVTQSPGWDTNPNLYNSIVKDQLDSAGTSGSGGWYFDRLRGKDDSVPLTHFLSAQPFTNALMSGLTGTLAENKSIEAKGEQELHPNQAILGNLSGQVLSVLGLAGFGEMVGLTKVTMGLGLAARGATPLAIRSAVAGSGQVLAEQTAGKLIQTGVSAATTNAALGVMYNSIMNAAKQGRALFDNSEGVIKQKAPDLVELGTEALKGLGWAPFAVGAPFAGTATGLATGTAAVFSSAVLMGKAQGMSNPDSVLNGIFLAAAHLTGGINLDAKTGRAILDKLTSSIGDYIGAKNQATRNNNSNRLAAQELVDSTAEQVVADKSTAIRQQIEQKTPEQIELENELARFEGEGGAVAKISGDKQLVLAVIDSLAKTHNPDLLGGENAEGTRGEAGEGSVKEETQGQAQVGVHLRDNAENGMEAQAGGKVISPDNQEGTGTEKVRGLSKSTMEDAIEKGLVDQLGELPSYKTRDMKDIAKKVNDFIDKDPELAKKIALLQAPEQDGIRSQEMYTGLVKRATLEDNAKLIQELGNSEQAAKMATELGQRVQALDTNDPHNPARIIQNVNKANERISKPQNVEKLAKKLSKISEKEEAIKKSDWDSFIDSIKC